MKPLIVKATVCAAVLWGATAQAATPPQKCQQAKNKAAGKYASCRESAEAKLAVTGDTSKYNDAIDKCEAKYQSAWQRAEAKAVAAGGACTTTGDETGVKDVTDEYTDNVSQHLGGAPLQDCPGDLATCDGSLTTCNTSLTTCNTGTAGVGDVLSGKTFSSSAGLGVIGTMASNGAVTLTPSTTDQAIAAGYHNGSGKCVGDADLASGNIRSGVNLFGVNGSTAVVDTSTATATATDMVSGKTAYVNGSLVTGSVTAGANVSGGNGLATFTIPDGLYSGSKTATANDTNLAAANIKRGVTILGVTGSLSLPKTGQTSSYGTGSDGAVQAGSTRSFTSDNTLGTITDSVTGLMWEMKDDNNAGGVHDKDNVYTWGMTSAPYTMNGTMVTDFLVKMNDRCDGNETIACTLNSDCTAYGNGLCGHAGHRDWRVPNFLELQTIWDMEKNSGSAPTTFAAFNTTCSAACTVGACSCTRSYYYWSSTTTQDYPDYAWVVGFGDGYVGYGYKGSSYAVRAVRGGL